MPTKQKRPVDKLVEENLSKMEKSFVLIKRSKIKSWQMVLLAGFVGGFLAAIIWAVTYDVQTTSKAASDTVQPSPIVNDFKIFQDCYGQPANGECAKADFDGNGAVGISDFGLLKSTLKFDLSNDMVVDFGIDHEIFRSCFGQPAIGDCQKADFDGNGAVGISDFGLHKNAIETYDLNGDKIINLKNLRDPRSDIEIFKSCFAQPAIGDCQKADFDGNGAVDYVDLGLLGSAVKFDLNNDNKITLDRGQDSDFDVFLSCWLKEATGDCARSDFDGNGAVGISDFGLLRDSMKYDLNRDGVVDLQKLKAEPYRLKIGALYPSDSSFNGAYPNYNQGSAYISFISLSKNPTYAAGRFQSTTGRPYFSNANNNGNNEPLKLAWTNAGGSYGEGELTIEGEASITVNFDNNPITIYLPIEQEWKRTNFLGYNTNPDGTREYLYDAFYLYVAIDGSTYWDEGLTQIARQAPTQILCSDSDGGNEYYVSGETSGYLYDDAGNLKTLNDNCSDNAVTEYYCKFYEGGDRYIDEVTIPCPYGCQNGSCILKDEANLTCIDSDNGLDYFNRGEVAAGNYFEVDQCNGSQLIEAFCQNGNNFLNAQSSITGGVADGNADITLLIRGKMDDSPLLKGNFRKYITITYDGTQSINWSDNDFFDPANYLLVIAKRNANAIGTLPENTFNINVDGKEIKVYLPPISYTDTNGAGYIAFYIAKDGSTYYAKKDHLPAGYNLGVDELWASVDLSPTEAINPVHLAVSSHKIGDVMYECPGSCQNGACVDTTTASSTLPTL